MLVSVDSAYVARSYGDGSALCHLEPGLNPGHPVRGKKSRAISSLPRIAGFNPNACFGIERRAAAAKV